MWIPKSEAELIAAIDTGTLSETATFDAKRELPSAGKSINLAIDVAAMSVDGGVLLYGIAEDERGQPTVLAPFALAGVRERVDSIVRSAISEPPTIEVALIPTEVDPAIGYIVVAVPPSPRAPHMVVKDRDHRFYGRSATGNVLLSEGEVARLYERRQGWAVDRDAIIAREIAKSPVEPHQDYGFLYIGVRPVIPDDNLLDRVKVRLEPQARDARPALDHLLRAALGPDVFPSPYSPDMDRSMRWEPGADGYRVSVGFDWYRQSGQPNHILTFAVDYDGGAHLFCGRAAHRHQHDLRILEVIVVGLTTRFFRLLGGLYEAAAYFGPVDVGLAVTGIADGVSAYLSQRHGMGAFFADEPLRYDHDQYHRTAQISAVELLRDPATPTRRLTERLYRATSNNWYDPFARN